MKLTKAELKQRDTISNDLRKAVEKFNENCTQENLAAFAVEVDSAEQFRNDIVERLQGIYDDKSEKWQEGEKGEALMDLIGQWENESFDQPDLNDASLLNEDLDDEIADTLDGLPDSAE